MYMYIYVLNDRLLISQPDSTNMISHTITLPPIMLNIENGRNTNVGYLYFIVILMQKILTFYDGVLLQILKCLFFLLTTVAFYM